jgi:hypothetical protein
MVSEVTVTGFLETGSLAWTAGELDGNEMIARKRAAAITKDEKL